MEKINKSVSGTLTREDRKKRAMLVLLRKT